MGYRIKEMSDISGISIRMMRHYDKTGLLKPDGISSNGYRDYSEDDIDRLQKIMYLRELDFSIPDMKHILDGSEDDMVIAMKGQKELLIEKRERLDGIIKLIGQSIDREELSKNMDKFKAFDIKKIEEHKKKYVNETKEKYGKSKEFAQSMIKASKYTKEDWKKITNEADAIYSEIADLMNEKPDSKEAVAGVIKWRKHITKYYYDCSDEVFIGLADMYVADPRFTKNIDEHKEGLARFMSSAMKASCNKQSKI